MKTQNYYFSQIPAFAGMTSWVVLENIGANQISPARATSITGQQWAASGT